MKTNKKSSTKNTENVKGAFGQFPWHRCGYIKYKTTLKDIA